MEGKSLKPDQQAIKVIAAGLPRTGTASLKRALEQLGYGPCFHLAEPPTQFSRIRFSADILNTQDDGVRQAKLRALFSGFDSALEQPASSCLLDMLELYPGAKVILTERSSAAVWLDSWRGIGIDVRSWRFRWAGWWMPGVKSSSDLYRAWVRLAAERFDVAPEPSEDLYHAHHTWVTSVVPPERLLIFRPEMGWGPLCRFLGKEIPAGRPMVRDAKIRQLPFPQTNERGVLRFYKQMAMLCGIISWLLMLFLVWVMAASL